MNSDYNVVDLDIGMMASVGGWEQQLERGTYGEGGGGTESDLGTIRQGGQANARGA
jgi:hypothetical protein